jgi:D-glycero-alpha-D-manno-heptose-7-phosphate kinase
VIITSSPLRISLGGGGTDLPSYYREHTGFVISAAINKYVYITLHETFAEEIIVKYSKMEVVQSADEIKHPIVREALKLVGVVHPHLEITSMSDIPAGTGLGSSGSFTTALLRALHCLNRNSVPARELAEQACHIELELLGEPIGKQDQYIAAFGGLTCFHFTADRPVHAERLKISDDTLADLEDHLLLFFTGYSRSASAILKDQNDRSIRNDSEMIENLHCVKRLGLLSKEALEQGNTRRFAEIMHEHWERKRKRSGGVSNPMIDEQYELAMKNGALGGKLIGAGGGGFLMFYSADNASLRKAMRSAGLREVRFRFDFEGTKLLANE